MDIEKKYQQTLDYLYSFVDYSLTRAFRYAPEKFELGRMRDFMEFLGNPQDSYAIIHVAGTKGKGSVSALCASALQSSGYQVGLYTSPHLVDYCERIQLNRHPISHEDLIALVDEIRPELDKGTKLTTFEITTALAFLYFARKEVDIAVAEVGLGGRLDATNIVTPLVSVITSLSLDHIEILGDTLEKIAAEKGGIIKPGVPLVLSPQKEEARRVIELIAQENQSPLYLVGRDFQYSPILESLDGQTLRIWQEPGHAARDLNTQDLPSSSHPLELSIPLIGAHQLQNAATAYAALKVINGAGFDVPNQAIVDGFGQVEWPGRFEILSRNPFLILDSAHNRDSAEKLRHTVTQYFPGRRVILVFGVSEDKDIRGMLTELLPVADKVIATKSIHPRALAPDALAEIVIEFGVQPQQADTIEQAMDLAVELVEEGGIILVAGSIFVAAGARDYWYNHLQKKMRSF